MRGAVRIGTRGSALALAQSRLVERWVGELGAGVSTELVPIRTSGDRVAAAGDKSRFVKEIEQALLDGDVDLAVHSAKDVPAELPGGLAIVGVPARADPRDALVGAGSLDALAPGARVGTASLRRRAQLLAAREDLDVVELRGNVDTRLRRLDEGVCDAAVLACAGLERLGRAVGTPLSIEALTPAPGQGCLALEARAGDDGVAEIAAALTDREALICLTAERALVERIGASCHTPVGAHAALDGERLVLRAFVGRPDGSAWVRDELEGEAGSPAALGREVGERVLAAGGAEVLGELVG